MKKVSIISKIMALLLAVCLGVGMTAAPVQAATSTAFETQVSKIVKKQVKKTPATKKQKKAALKKLFKYAEKTYGYKRTTAFKNTSGWDKKYAKAMYKSKKGSCYHFAAAYAYLAKKATDYETRICIGKTKGFTGKWQPHAWVEIKIGSSWYVCDPNMDKFAAKSKLKYYLKKSTSKAMKKVYKTTSTVAVEF